MRRTWHFWAAAAAMTGLLTVAYYAAYGGWAVASEANAKLQAASARRGSVVHSGLWVGGYTRYRLFDGGPGFGK